MRALLKRVTSRGRRETGATLVEYALIVALVAGVSIGGLNVLTSSASDEVASTADCISKRPQPASCTTSATDPTTTVASVPASSTTTTAPPAATTTTTTTAPPTTTTTTAPPTTTTTAAPSYTGGFTSSSSTCTKKKKNGTCQTWQASTTLTVSNHGSAVAGADIVVTLSTGGNLTCTTDANGQCDLTTGDLIWSSVGSVRFTLNTVEGLAPASAASMTVNKP